jgi:nicotinate-nucleotide adenylyltransferase
MVELAIAGNERFLINDYELNLGQPAFTVDTVQHFRQMCPQTRFFWFIGADSLADLPKWRSPQALVEQVDVVTAVRGGCDIEAILAGLAGQLPTATIDRLKANVVRTPAIEVASSDIRKRLAEGRSIRYLVCDSVRKYIEDNGLYTTCSK